MGVSDKLVLSLLPHVPKALLRRVAQRYFAGETLAEALVRLRQYAALGHPGIIDILGEDVTTEAAARAVLAEYAATADALRAASLDAYVSVKPTHCGLRISEALALELYRALCAHCARLGLFVRVEMEDHTTTDATLRIFESLRREFRDVGIVLQSRLLRTPDDIARIAPGPLSVRMVKGIYIEPGSLAHTEPDPIRDAYVSCCEQLFERRARVSFATHDGPMAERLLANVKRRGLSAQDYEFQVLMGVQEPLWKVWQSGGHVVRVYVPFGPQWRPYSLRRMRKNPAIVRHVMRQALGLG